MKKILIILKVVFVVIIFWSNIVAGSNNKFETDNNIFSLDSIKGKRIGIIGIVEIPPTVGIFDWDKQLYLEKIPDPIIPSLKSKLSNEFSNSIESISELDIVSFDTIYKTLNDSKHYDVVNNNLSNILLTGLTHSTVKFKSGVSVLRISIPNIHLNPNNINVEDISSLCERLSVDAIAFTFIIDSLYVKSSLLCLLGSNTFFQNFGLTTLQIIDRDGNLIYQNSVKNTSVMGAISGMLMLETIGLKEKRRQIKKINKDVLPILLIEDLTLAIKNNINGMDVIPFKDKKIAPFIFPKIKKQAIRVEWWPGRKEIIDDFVLNILDDDGIITSSNQTIGNFVFGKSYVLHSSIWNESKNNSLKFQLSGTSGYLSPIYRIENST